MPFRNLLRSGEILLGFLVPTVCGAACSGDEFTSSSPDGGSAGSGGANGTGGRETGGASGAGTGGNSGTGGRASGGAGTGGGATGGTGAGGVASGGAGGGGGIGSPCRADTDCSRQNFLYCAAPGASVGCGICPTPGIFPSCATDADCNPDSGGSRICVGSCGGACPDKECTAGCVDNTPCGEGTHCGATHRCEPLSCTTGAGCPANFDCVGSICTRRSCTADTACQGFCVTSYCYSTIGHCDQPRA